MRTFSQTNEPSCARIIQIKDQFTEGLTNLDVRVWRGNVYKDELNAVLSGK
jgi:hypothetical protein